MKKLTELANGQPLIHAMNRLPKALIRAAWRCVQRIVLRSDPWTYGKYKSLKSRKHRDGQMEIWAERTNPNHSLWIEAHPDHWGEFQANNEHRHGNQNLEGHCPYFENENADCEAEVPTN